MDPILWVALGLAWWLIGTAGFVFHWTFDFDLKLADLVFAMVIGAMLGPNAWWVGFLVHPRRPSRVLLRRRRAIR